eukprot:3365755-Rhodomonas_salina.4
MAKLQNHPLCRVARCRVKTRSEQRSTDALFNRFQTVMMGFEAVHAAAAEGDDQELRKCLEGLDKDRQESTDSQQTPFSRLT